MFDDPEALLGGLLTPETRRSSDQLTALAVVIDGYADHVADLVGQKLVGSHSQLTEAWYRRRTERGKGEEAAGALFGLDLDQTQVDRGRSFITGVVERAGEDGLAKLWSSARNLPTPSEVDAPGLWLERISLPELDDPTGLSALARTGGRTFRPRRLGGVSPSGVSSGASSTGHLLFGYAQVPLEQDVLPLGIADHPLAVAPVLRIVGRKEHQPGHGPAAELLDQDRVSVVGAHLPVGGDRPEVHDPDVTDRRQRLPALLGQDLIVGDRGHGSGSS